MSKSDARLELPSGVRVIRRLAPPEAPWPSALVRTDDGGGRMLVDAALLQTWDGWDAAPGGHVLAPLDLLRRADGHDVLLALCTERVDALLARRGSGLPLAPGEAVTLAVSVLRGMVEVAQRDVEGARGSWWLTDEGRPVFVDQPDGPAAESTTAELLERLTSDAAADLAEALRDAAAAVRDPRTLTREIEHVERRLFVVADAEPLATAPLASARMRHAAGEREDSAADTDGDGRLWGTALLAAVDADFADTVSRATTSLWRRMRRPVRRSRRRPWALAGCLGAGLITVGLLWPAPGGPAVAGDDAPTSTSADVIDTTAAAVIIDEPAAGEPPDPVVAGGDLAAVADALLETRRRCLAKADDACLGEVIEDPARPLPPGVADAATGARVLTLLDEFGGVAVLRAESTTGGMPAQLVVITDRDGRWLLRDIHDVAQQP